MHPLKVTPRSNDFKRALNTPTNGSITLEQETDNNQVDVGISTLVCLT